MFRKNLEYLFFLPHPTLYTQYVSRSCAAHVPAVFGGYALLIRFHPEILLQIKDSALVPTKKQAKSHTKIWFFFSFTNSNFFFFKLNFSSDRFYICKAPVLEYGSRPKHCFVSHIFLPFSLALLVSSVSSTLCRAVSWNSVLSLLYFISIRLNKKHMSIIELLLTDTQINIYLQTSMTNGCSLLSLPSITRTSGRRNPWCSVCPSLQYVLIFQSVLCNGS